APPTDLLCAVIFARSYMGAELVHAPGRIEGLTSIDRSPEPLFEVEAPFDGIPQDLGPVEVANPGHPLLHRPVHLETHDFHAAQILLVIHKDYLSYPMPPKPVEVPFVRTRESRARVRLRHETGRSDRM